MAHPADIQLLYRDASFQTRLHIAGRMRLFDFRLLEAYVPPEGTFLDIGCGHGVWAFWMARLRPQAAVWGVDPDTDKIGVARAAATANNIANTRFEIGRAQDVALPECVLASLVDMMYLIPHDEQERILRSAVERLQPGGRLLLKTVAERPRWKFAWNVIEETLAVHLLGITYGGRFYFRPRAEWQRVLTGLGLDVQTVRLDRGYIHPHVLFVGQKP
jgi:2-polyprenyl-3-methyl-5-hydroxy-6-metoxy-1,4-benzoquinol methylase